MPTHKSRGTITRGTITRGTTNPNRLRRVDRWLSRLPAIRSGANPLIVDLGFGSNAVTTFELTERLAHTSKRHAPATHTPFRVVGIEIDPERVHTAQSQLAELLSNPETFPIARLVEFRQGGFEIPTQDNELVTVIRAFNVLRQYDEHDVQPAWQLMQNRLTEQGVLIDGTCDELGRVCSWIAVTRQGPQTLTLSLRLRDLEKPSILAERLPKVLIHHNVEGERIHTFLEALDEQWVRQASLATFSAQQRWVRCVSELKQAGWPIRAGASIWKLGEVTVDYAAVAPAESTR